MIEAPDNFFGQQPGGTLERHGRTWAWPTRTKPGESPKTRTRDLNNFPSAELQNFPVTPEQVARFHRWQPEFLPGFKSQIPSLLLLLLAFATLGCRQEMYNQPRAKPLRGSAFFNDGMSARPLVAGTIPRGYLRTNDLFYRGLVGTNLLEEIPLPITAELLARGQERYNIYCAVCHDANGEGDGMVVRRGFPRPPSYHIDRLRAAPAGHFYRVITYGYGVMYSYANRVSPADRWAITAYIRALQLRQQASTADVRAELRPTGERSHP